ncbi:tyrosine-type recombinase/integrase [Agromyces sp. Marseille-Q5079]|uniref:tyrosine-type recombinase/integrase n=1 Tax=Agromyces sp. Marseille-Q5079 TaxID=3439059 RepID=UPI003D9CA9B4
MPRPPLPVGTWGKVTRAQIEPKKWRARAKLRDFTGRTIVIEASGKSGADAQRRLESRLRERVATAGEFVTGETSLRVLGDLWLAERESSEDLSPQSLAQYRWAFDRVICPGAGQLRVREATTSALDRFLKEVSARTPSQARVAKVVLSGMLALAVRHDAIQANPVREVAPLRRVSKEVRALSVADVHALRVGVRAWQSAPDQNGQRRSADIPDVVDVLLATGARIGELCALRWADVSFAGDRATVTISGTVVRLKGQGLIRQPHPKSDAGFRTVTLPRFAVETLRRRRADAPLGTELIFPSRTGTLREPANVRRAWRDARDAAGFDWVVPHTFRKTVATLIDQEASTASAASQLGHAREGVTVKHYVQRAAIAPDVSEVLQRFEATA